MSARSVSLFAAATLAMLGAELATAQPMTPPPPELYRMSRGEAPFPNDPDPRDAIPLSEIEAQAGLDKYADCLVGKRKFRSQVNSFVRAIPGTKEWNELGGKLMERDCALAVSGGGSVQITIRMDFMRLALFGALYRKEYKKEAPDILEGLPPLDIAAEFDGPTSWLDPLFLADRRLGDCVARSASADVRKLLFIERGDPKEAPAIESLIPAMQLCLDKGEKAYMKPYELRGIIAESAYRLAQASSAVATSNVGEKAH